MTLHSSILGTYLSHLIGSVHAVDEDFGKNAEVKKDNIINLKTTKYI